MDEELSNKPLNEQIELLGTYLKDKLIVVNPYYYFKSDSEDGEKFYKNGTVIKVIPCDEEINHEYFCVPEIPNQNSFDSFKSYDEFPLPLVSKELIGMPNYLFYNQKIYKVEVEASSSNDTYWKAKDNTIKELNVNYSTAVWKNQIIDCNNGFVFIDKTLIFTSKIIDFNVSNIQSKSIQNKDTDEIKYESSKAGKAMQDFFEFTKRTEEASKKALTLAEKKFSEIDEITEYNQRKVLAAFINNRVDETDFNSTTGYGYNDKGREKLDKLTAEIFGAEDGLIRANTLTCGTHTIATALYGVLRPGDIMLSVTGVPYDTIHSVIGIDKSSKGHGSLADFGVKFEYIELTENDEIDYDAIEKRVGCGDIKMVYIQRSRGYSLRHSISVDEIEKIATLTHRVSPDTVVMTDNCYGEFVERMC